MLSLRIALRFLTSSKVQTIGIALGIAVGISVQVFVGTLIISLQQSLVEATIGNAPHITVLAADDGLYIDDWQPYIQTIEGVGDVRDVSVSLSTNVLMNTPDDRTFPGLVRGFEIENSDGIYDISSRIYEGTAPDSNGEVLVGLENQEEYGLSIGDTLEVTLGNGSIQDVTISGFFDFEVATLNEGWVISNLGTVQSLLDEGDVVSAIEMQVGDPFSADSTAKKVEKAIASDKVVVSNWKTENEQLLGALAAQGQSSYMIQFFVIIAVFIAIASILAISVTQKSKQLGILKAMGITDVQSSLIFMFQGLFLGVIGGALGVGLGYGLFMGFIVGASSSISPFVDWGFIIGSGVMAVAASTIASMIPAVKSLRLNPIEVIRNG